MPLPVPLPEKTMRLRSLLLFLMLLLIAAFVVVNWPLFIVPASLNLLFTTVDAPLGLVMLALMVAVVVVFALYMVLWQGGFLLASRRHAKELKEQRLLADQAESSRFTELRGVLLAETGRLNERIDGLQQSLRVEIRDQGNALAASLGEIDDRYGRSLAPPR